MGNLLVSAAKGIFQEETIVMLAERNKVAVEEINRALDAILPILFFAIQRKSKTELEHLLDKAQVAFNGLRPQTDDMVTIPLAAEILSVREYLLQALLNDQVVTVQDTLSNYLAMDRSAVKSVLETALPALFSVLTAGGQSWDADGVSTLLEEHQDGTQHAIPAGLGSLVVDTNRDQAVHAGVTPATPADAIIDPSYTATPQQIQQAEQGQSNFVHTAQTVKRQQKGSKIWWLLLLIFLVALWVVFGKSCSNSPRESQQRDSVTTLPRENTD